MRQKRISLFVLLAAIGSNMVVHAGAQNIRTNSSVEEEPCTQTIVTENYEINPCLLYESGWCICENCS